MRKKIIYLIILIACISFSAFRKECNNDGDGTSFKKNNPETIIPGSVQEELNFSPITNLLKI